MNETRDNLYSDPHERIEPFRFDAAVARVFRDMIERSVPGYGLILEMIEIMAREFAQPGTRCYDLGCSLGDATLAIAKGVGERDLRVIAVDNSEEMMRACRHNLTRHPHPVAVEMACQDICDTPIENASFVTLNFTLQFIPVAQRLPLLTRIADGMVPGGALLLSEKVIAESAQTEETHVRLHEAFKRMRGYSDLEIAQKRAALEEVLVRETLATHAARLHDAGFSDCWPWFQCLDFVSLLARK